MNGGSRTAVISQVWSVPTRNPASRLARQPAATTAPPTGLKPTISAGASASIVEAHTVVERAIIDPAERSMPPAMITTAAPSAKMPSRAVLRAMSRRLASG